MWLHYVMFLKKIQIRNISVVPMPLCVVTGRFITRSVYYWKNGRFVIFNSIDDSMNQWTIHLLAVGRFTTIHVFMKSGRFTTGRAVLFDTK